MFRLVNINERAAFDHDGSWYDLAELSGDAMLADPLEAIARHRELHALYARCASVSGGGLVAGLTLGQDVSDRAVQMTGVPPRFCLGKSFANYGPIGPALVSIDAFADPDDLALWCDVAGERMQAARSSQLIFSIPTLVAYLSSICRLYPGDLVFTGTPSGVGMARGRCLAPGETIVSGADVIGELHNTCRPGAAPLAT